MRAARYVIDPLDPRAPSREVWAELTESERRTVVDSLPSELPRALPPEGDPGSHERFEEHYFGCAVCLERVERLQRLVTLLRQSL